MSTPERCGRIARRASTWLLGGWCLLVGLSAAAQPPDLSLDEAVKLTLQRSPDLALVRTDVMRREGFVREMRGLFDTTLSLSSTLEYKEGLLSAQSKSDEERQRVLLSEIAKAFERLRDQLAVQIERKLLGRPACPGDLPSWEVTLGDETYRTDVMCAPLPGGQDDFEFTASAQAYQALFNSIFSSPVSEGPTNSVDFLVRLQEILGLQAEDAAEEVREKAYETVQTNYRLAVEISARAALALERRGIFPEREYQRSLDVSASLTKAFRWGTTLQLEGAVRGIENNFRDKPLDPKFGGKGLNSVFRSRAGVTLTQPLLRGRGRGSAAAPERSAKQGLLAAQERLRHELARQTLAACDAYFQLQAAQETLALLEDTLEIEHRVVQGTRALLKARDVARTDLTRAQARETELAASVTQARVTLVNAQTALAETMGIKGEAPGARLVAGQKLPEAPAEVDVESLARGARGRRHDLAAAQALRESSRILLEGARIDLRRRVDLSLQAGMATDYFSPFFRVLKDESIRDVNEPPEAPVDYFSPTGFGRSMSDRWQPYVGAKITVELPFGNRRARGRLRQAQATDRRSAIVAADLEREIDHGVLNGAYALQRAGEELRRRSEAAEHHDENWKNAEALRAAGEMNLIDTLLTEQQRTAARLALVRARHDYAAALAQYRWETGTLVEVSGAESARADLGGLSAAR